MCWIAKTVAAVHAGVFLGGCASRWWALCLCCCITVECFILRASAGRERRSTLSKTPWLSLGSCLKGVAHCTAHHLTPTISQYKNVFCSRLKQTTSATLATSSSTTTTKTLLSAVRWVQAFMHGRRRSKPHPKKNHYRLRTSGRRPGFNLWETFFFIFCRDILAEC